MKNVKEKFFAEQSKAENFLKKYKISALKFIILLLNCTLGPTNLGVRGARAPGPLPLGSASECLMFLQYYWLILNSRNFNHWNRVLKKEQNFYHSERNRPNVYKLFLYIPQKNYLIFMK